MKKSLTTLIIIAMSLNMHAQKQESAESNPFFSPYNTPFEVPPFNLIKNEHFKPAFEKGIEEQKHEIKTILKNKQKPTFENTIMAMENSGKLLSKVSTVFYNLNSANTSDEIQKIAQELAPMMSAHQDEIMLNELLFERVKYVWDNKKTFKLNLEESKLLEKTYKRFVRNGANLDENVKNKLKSYNSEIASLTLQFGQNMLAETNNYTLLVKDKSELKGLSDEILQNAASTAKSKGEVGYMFTLQNSSIMPFLQYAESRKLRQEIWTAYKDRASDRKLKVNTDANGVSQLSMVNVIESSDKKEKAKNDKHKSNDEIAVRIANMRYDKAKMLGYKNYAAYSLEETMAKTPEKVREFLMSLWEPTKKMVKTEANQLQELMLKDGIDDVLKPYDWRYYSEKLRKEKFDLDENELKPYFSLEAVTNGVFYVCKELWGLTFKEVKGAPTYHPDATLWEVFDKDKSHLGVLYMDFHPRESKRGGAWMTSYRSQEYENGKRKAPVISIVCNFSKPTENAPALFTFDEVTTYFHEFGHALHGLLSDVKIKSLAGTSVSRDFVELPSQVMENWASDPEVLKVYAKHYKTGETIPDALIKKLEDAGTFGQGFATAEYLASALLDMDFHDNEGYIDGSAEAFEIKTMLKYGLHEAIIPRHRANLFSHIFAGGYAAGYYSYIWSGVLDTDAFDQFKKTSLFNQEKAASFRKNILERGGTEDPMELYKRFRGSEPSTEPLLRKRGLDKVK